MARVASSPLHDEPRSPARAGSPMQAVVPLPHQQTSADDLRRQPTPPATGPTLWVYELRPSHDLPVVDLSVSVKSRFLSERMLVAFSKMVSYRRSIFVGLVFGLAIGPVSLGVNTRLGRPLAVVGSLFALPAVLAGVSLLRYNLVKLLLWTYDVQFSLILSVTALAAFWALLQDARCSLLLISILGLLPNIFIDANLRAVQMTTLLTGLHFVSIGLSTAELMLDMIPDVQTEMTLVSYGSHALPVKMFVTNGLATATVILLRNFYRKREAIFHRKNPSFHRCVTYRTRLRLTPAQPRSLSKRSTKRSSPAVANTSDRNDATNSAGIDRSNELSSNKGGPRISLSPRAGVAAPNLSQLFESNVQSAVTAFLQQLRYDRGYWAIDARNTVCPAIFALVVHSSTPTRQRLLVALFRILGITAFVVSAISYPMDRWVLPHETTETHGKGLPVFQCIALALTLAFISWLLALAQRNLLRAFVLSFDFAYLSAHLVFLCWCLCDFFRWNHHSILIFVVGLWLHCPMCIDVMTPPVRRMLGIRVRLIAALSAFTTLGSTAVTSYMLVFSPNSNTNVYDRVVWTARIQDHGVVEVRIMPFFYSCGLTALLLMLRFVFRAATYSDDDLVLIDGPVVLSNCFRRRTAPAPTAEATTNTS